MKKTIVFIDEADFQTFRNGLFIASKAFQDSPMGNELQDVFRFLSEDLDRRTQKIQGDWKDLQVVCEDKDNHLFFSEPRKLTYSLNDSPTDICPECESFQTNPEIALEDMKDECLWRR
jgi:hypothetical protein